MKLKFLTLSGILCVATLGSILFSLYAGAEELNRDFGIETLYGDISLLDDIYLGAVIREGRNQFSSVRLTSDGFEIRPTVYDLHNGVGEEVLNNRELFRGNIWFDPNSLFETEALSILPSLNENFRWDPQTEAELTLAIQEKETGNVKRETFILDEIPNSANIMGPFMMKHDNVIYLVIIVDGIMADVQRGPWGSMQSWSLESNGAFFVYSLNPEAISLNLEFEGNVPIDENSWPHWIVTNMGIYANLTTWDESTQQESQSTYKIDLTSKEVIPVENLDLPHFWNFVNHNEYIIYLHEEWHDTTNAQTFTLNAVNMQTGEKHTFPMEDLDNNTDQWSFGANLMIVDNHLFVNRTFSAQRNHNTRPIPHQLIQIYDVEKMELLYEGRIRLRHDQGLVGNMHWLQGFTLREHD